MLPNYASRNSGIPVSFDSSREDLYKICADPPSEPTTRSSRAEGLAPRLTGRACGRGPGRSARSCPRLSAVLFSRCRLSPQKADSECALAIAHLSLLRALEHTPHLLHAQVGTSCGPALRAHIYTFFGGPPLMDPLVRNGVSANRAPNVMLRFLSERNEMQNTKM